MALRHPSRPRLPRSAHPLTRSAAVLTSVLLLGTGLASCAKDVTGGGSDAASGNTIKIGVSESITGDLATYGIAERQAIELAIDQANQSGGVNGKQLQMVFYDPAGDTSKGVDQVHRMIQQDHVNVVVGGGSSSGVALAMKPILAQAGVAFVSAEAAADITDPASAAPTTFSTCISTDIVAQKMMEYLTGKGVKTVGVLSSSDGYGKSGAASLTKAAAAAGVTLNAVEYDPAVTDLTSQLRGLQSSKPGAVINWTAGSTGVVYFKNAKDLGLDKSSIVMSSFTFSNPALMKQAGDASKGAIVAGVKATLLSTLPASDPDKKLLTDFDKALQDKYQVNVTIYAAEAYDAANVAIAGIKAAGTTDGAKLATSIAGLTLDGTQGTYKFSADNHRGLSTDNLEMMQWNGSAFVQVKDGA